MKKNWITAMVFVVLLPMGMAGQQRTKTTQSSRPSSVQTTSGRSDSSTQKVSSPANKSTSNSAAVSPKASGAKDSKADAQLTPRERARQHRQAKQTQTKK